MQEFFAKRAPTKTSLALKVYKLGLSLIHQIQDMAIIFQKKYSFLHSAPPIPRTPPRDARDTDFPRWGKQNHPHA